MNPEDEAVEREAKILEALDAQTMRDAVEKIWRAESRRTAAQENLSQMERLLLPPPQVTFPGVNEYGQSLAERSWREAVPPVLFPSEVAQSLREAVRDSLKHEKKWEPGMAGSGGSGDGGPKRAETRPARPVPVQRALETRAPGSYVPEGLSQCQACKATVMTASMADHQRWHDTENVMKEQQNNRMRGAVMECRTLVEEMVRNLRADVAKAMALMETVMAAIEAEDD